MERPTRHPDNISLDSLQPHQSGIITNLAGGHTMLSRMTTLGFTPGAEVTMIQNMGRGPLIVLVRGGRVALGRGEAGKVWVRAVGDA